MVVGEHPGGGRQAPGTDDDAQRLEVSRGGLSRLVTDCEGRVVGEGGAGAHHDGVALTAQVVGVAAGRRRGDPLAGAVVGGNTAVEGGGELPRHHGAAAGHGQEPRAVETRGVLGAQPTPYPHAGGLQRRRATSGLLGRVVLGVNDLGHACGEERLDARAGAALVVARLEGDDGGRSLGGGTCRGEVRQCVDLGVGGAGATVVALGEDVAVGGEDDATDPGVGAGRGVGGGRGPEGASHRGRLHGGERSHPVLSLGCAGERHRHAGLTGCTAPVRRGVSRVRFPSGLSPSVQEFHLVSRSLDATGSRTVTAGSDFHRPQSTRAHLVGENVPRASALGRLPALM